MNTKWTRGPWVNSNGLVNGIESRPGLSGTSLDIFDAAEWPAELQDEAMATAALIAAGPDLVAALQFILAFYDPGQRYLDTDAWKLAEASGRAALAKAFGQTS
jgi:hypothetical protein